MKKLVAVIFGALIVQTPFFSQEQAGDSSVQFEFKSTKMFLLTVKKATTHLL